MKLTKEQRKERRKKIWSKIVAFFHKVEEKILPFVLDASLKFMQSFKFVVSTGILDKLADLTPTEADDRFLDVFESKLDKIISGLLISQECLAKQTLIEKVLCVASHIKSLPKEQQGNLYNQLHTAFVKEMHEGLDGVPASNTEYAMASLGTYYGSKLDS